MDLPLMAVSGSSRIGNKRVSGSSRIGNSRDYRDVILCATLHPRRVRTLTVGQPQTPKLSLTTQSLSFTFTSSSGQSSQQLSVTNQGGGTIAFAASAATTT